MSQTSSSPCRRQRSTTVRSASASTAAAKIERSREEGLEEDEMPSRDLTLEIPDECLALVFHSLPSGDRKQCSLVCRRWFAVDGQSRHRLSLDARAALAGAVPSLFRRFDSVSKLALKCDRRSDSISDYSLLSLIVFLSLFARLEYFN